MRPGKLMAPLSLTVLIFVVQACGGQPVPEPVISEPPAREPVEISSPTLSPTQIPSSATIDLLTSAIVPTDAFVPPTAVPPTSAHPPTDMPFQTNTPLPALPDFDQMIGYGGGGGSLGYVGYCYAEYEILHPISGPAISGTSATLAFDYSERMGALCFRNVKPGLPFSVRLVSPDGGITLDGKFIADGETLDWEGHSAQETYYWGQVNKDGLIDGELRIWWPPGMPFGQWQVIAEGDGLQAQGSFEAPRETKEDFSINRIQEIGVTEPQSRTNLIPIKDELAGHGVRTMSDGGLKVNGAGFSPNGLVYILVYERTTESISSSTGWKLISKKSASADQNGFLASTLPGPFEKGKNYLVISLSDTGESLTGNDTFKYLNIEDPNIGYDSFYIAESTMSSSAGASCPGAPPQRMKLNHPGYVCTQNDHVRLHDNPARSANTIVYLPVGSQFTVIEGPVCADNWSWWKVNTVSGYTGWISEGGDAVDPYFICQVD